MYIAFGDRLFSSICFLYSAKSHKYRLASSADSCFDGVLHMFVSLCFKIFWDLFKFAFCWSSVPRFNSVVQCRLWYSHNMGNLCFRHSLLEQYFNLCTFFPRQVLEFFCLVVYCSWVIADLRGFWCVVTSLYHFCYDSFFLSYFILQWTQIFEKAKISKLHQGDIMSRKRRKKKYSPEIKAVTVQAYLSGKMSRWEICKIFNIPAERTLKLWIKCYNGHNGAII